MSSPLSIKFASKCAFAATARVVDLTDSTSINPATNVNQAMPEEATTFNTDFDADYALTYPFDGGSSRSVVNQMGFVSRGTGRRKRELLITFRGSNRLKDDFLYIDGAFALGTSPKGFAVHGGFAKVFQSCLPRIEKIISGFHFDTIHCVGHSMGGALATLCAEHFLETNITTYLYTFGAPRVGMLPHARYMEEHLGGRLNRYYYAGDVVTWLPMLPFVHMTGKRLLSPNASYASHIGYMSDNGLVLADRHKTPNTAQSWSEAESLIRQGTNVGGGVGMESRAWRYFTQALHKILYTVGAAMGLTLIPSITVVDQVVACISYFITQDPNRRPLIVSWLTGSFQALGRVVKISKDKFVAMLRYMLGLMLNQLKIKTERELAEARRQADIQQHRKRIIRFN